MCCSFHFNLNRWLNICDFIGAGKAVWCFAVLFCIEGQGEASSLKGQGERFQPLVSVLIRRGLGDFENSFTDL